MDPPDPLSPRELLVAAGPDDAVLEADEEGREDDSDVSGDPDGGGPDGGGVRLITGVPFVIEGRGKMIALTMSS